MTKKIISLTLATLLTGLVFLCVPAKADDKEKDEDRLRNSGQVLKEILNIPDDIPQNLIDKADCIVVIPSVLKAAFIVGGAYGRGAMTCRSGEEYERAVGRADHDGARRRQLRIPDRSTGHRFRSVDHEQGRRGLDSQQQSEARRGRIGRGWTHRARRGGGHGRGHARGSADVFAVAWTFCRDFAGRVDASSR